MKREPGLYVTLLSDNRIKKILTDENGEETESEVSIAEELLKYSDMLYEPYENLMLYAGSLLEEETLEADKKVFAILTELQSSLYKCNPMSAEILHVHIINEGSLISVPTMYQVIDRNLQSITAAQTVINCALKDLSAGIPIDMEQKYALIQNYELRELHFFDVQQSRTWYYFQAEVGYMIFLLLKFIESRQRVNRCRYCGKFFIPKTNRPTLYCDNIVVDGKTCKDLAPLTMHKVAAADQRVIKEFDRAKQRMYKRYERAGYGKKPSPKDLTEEEYSSWLQNATEARDKFLAGELTEAEALAVIIVP